jgi:hypothetical protein
VVGIFAAKGGIAESEIWTDAGVLAPAYRRGNTFQAVYARLESPDRFQEFKDRLTADPRLNVMVERQTDYYAEQSTVITGPITTVGSVMILMGSGAVFGALNTRLQPCRPDERSRRSRLRLRRRHRRRCPRGLLSRSSGVPSAPASPTSRRRLPHDHELAELPR